MSERRPDRSKNAGFTTRILTLGGTIEEVRQRALAVPVYQTATFAFDDLDEFAAVGRTKISGGYLYSRWANPTVETLARVCADLEGADAAACFSSGMAAIAGALAACLSAGDHVVASSQLYGGTHGLLHGAIVSSGVEITQVDIRDVEAVEKAFTDRTRVLYAETMGNPRLPVADLDALAEVAHRRGATFVVDATFTPPPMLRAFEHGADLVCHSATKYLSGHGDVVAGVVAGRADAIARVRHLQIDTGAILAPFEAWLCLRGLQTLALRLDRICDNATRIARALEANPAVERVLYPGLASHADHALARRLFGDRFGGMMAFECAGGYDAGRRFLERVRIASPAASLGATRTLVVHPPSVTHTQLTPEQRAAAGVTEGMIRLSVGIEDPDDLIADLEQALS